MHLSVVLLCLALEVAGLVCLPLQGHNSRRVNESRAKIEMLIKTTLFHISQDLSQVPHKYCTSHTPLTQLCCITGLATIWCSLGDLEEGLKGSVYQQVYEDVSGMRTWVQTLSQAKDCPPLNKKDEWASNTAKQSLVEGKKYMEALNLNRDKLKIC
uniref:Uncharacterized protein n=1 Tax=Esox lucius TaxID=8010 RepID=A0A3P8X778_ESOLU